MTNDLPSVFILDRPPKSLIPNQAQQNIVSADDGTLVDDTALVDSAALVGGPTTTVPLISSSITEDKLFTKVPRSS